MSSHRLIVGLAYGDEGKGGITDYFCSPRVPDPARAVVRFNGGPQAGHNVTAGDGREHCFAQFGAGTLQGASTFLSRFMMVDPLTLAAEAVHLTQVGIPDPYALLAVDTAALLVTPYHVAANRAREQARGAARHGSCGMGIGECAAYAAARPGLAPRYGDLLDPRGLAGKLDALRDWLRDVPGLDQPLPGTAGLAGRLLSRPVRETAARTAVAGTHLAGLLAAGPVVFEGAQGVLLDERHGFAPHVTWSDTTFRNAETLLTEAGEEGGSWTRMGVCRTYMTRHGAGPFVTEDAGLRLPEPHNVTGPWQGPVRQGHLDVVALRYAVAAAGGCDEITLTHVDTAASGGLRLCYAYHADGGIITRLPGPASSAAGLARARPLYADQPPGDWPGAVERALGVPVTVTSHGPDAAAKQETGAATAAAGR